MIICPFNHYYCRTLLFPCFRCLFSCLWLLFVDLVLVCWFLGWVFVGLLIIYLMFVLVVFTCRLVVGGVSLLLFVGLGYCWFDYCVCFGLIAVCKFVFCLV